MKDKKEYFCWGITDNVYSPMMETVPSIPSGYYEVFTDSNYNTHIRKFSPKREEITIYEDTPTDRVLNTIDTFAEKQETYKNMGLCYKRGFLLYGPTGSGKSACVNAMGDKVVNQHNGISLVVRGPAETSKFLRGFRDIEEGRLKIIIFEDIESSLKDSEEEASFLALFDGVADNMNNTIIVATTNYLEEIPDRFKNRPSRFDDIVEIPNPCAWVRENYLTNMLGGDYQSSFVEATTGYSFAHLKEFCIQVKVFGNIPTCGSIGTNNSICFKAN